MKKIPILSLMVGLLLCIATSCERSDELNVTSIDEFRNDALIEKISVELQFFKNAVPSPTITPEIKKSLAIITSSVQALNNKYGEDNVNRFIETLIKEQREKQSHLRIASTTDKCETNQDGTTNWEDCGFWESMWVCFKSASRCRAGTTPSTVPETAEDSMIEYFECVQDIICKVC